MKLHEEEILKELMADMNAMDGERLMKKKGPSITIAIGMPKKEEEGEETSEVPEMSEESEVPSIPALEEASSMPEMGEEEEDDEEDMLIEEAKGLGIKDPEFMDMRLLKKMIEKKKASV